MKTRKIVLLVKIFIVTYIYSFKQISSPFHKNLVDKLSFHKNESYTDSARQFLSPSVIGGSNTIREIVPSISTSMSLYKFELRRPSKFAS